MRALKFRLLLQCLAMFFAALFLSAASAAAQGVIVPGPCHRCPDGPRPIPLPRALHTKSIKNDTKILSLVATTHIEQIFRNDTQATSQRTYLFPIPDESAITALEIRDGDRRWV